MTEWKPTMEERSKKVMTPSCRFMRKNGRFSDINYNINGIRMEYALAFHGFRFAARQNHFDSLLIFLHREIIRVYVNHRPVHDR